jgi:hypothetical protein
MQVGLLWFDDDPRRPFEVKVEEAVERYIEKFGAQPNTCFVNPQTLPNGIRSHAGVAIRPLATVLPDHFWIGLSREDEVENADRIREWVVA